MKPTFESTVDILVKAYLNDTLQAGDCMACAVGNIIQAKGYNLQITCDDEQTYWLRVVEKIYRPYKHTPKLSEREQRIGLEQIASTGYNAFELEKIEHAFEFPRHYFPDDDYGIFSGLMAVVDALADIHGIDLKAKEEAKLLFVKP